MSVLTSPDLKVQLQATDYGNFLQNEPSPVPVAIIDEKLRSHLVVEFTHMRNQSVPPLSTFLDYVTYVCCVYVYTVRACVVYTEWVNRERGEECK